MAKKDDMGKAMDTLGVHQLDLLKCPTRDFYRRRALEVAPDMLGLILVRVTPDGTTAGRIIEAEAYEGPEDRACHAFGGRRTQRTEVMFGEPGFAYVHFAYGMHWMLNVVTGDVGTPHGVLIRSIEPLLGVDLMSKRRHGATPLAIGPGRLTQAMEITGADNASDLIRGDLYIAYPAPPMSYPVKHVITKRIGIQNTGEAKDYPWRFVTAE